MSAATPNRKTIIAGGRDYHLTPDDMKYLAGLPISEVVSGGATGADAGGELFAAAAGLPVRRFPADWKGQGRAAGMIRNRQMAEYGEVLVAFPGGKGTSCMVYEARKKCLLIHDLRGSRPSVYQALPSGSWENQPSLF